MHISRIYTYDNIVYYKESVSYYYKIRPINSLFASESQKATLLEKFSDLILDINMPGFFMVRPKKVNNQKVYQAYADSYKVYGKPEFLDLAKSYIADQKEILQKAIKYRYEIYFVFCDGREEMKKRKNIALFPIESKPLKKDELELYQVAEQEIYKRMCKHIDTDKVTDQKKLEQFHNYLALPLEKDIEDYYVQEEPAHLHYEYQSTKSSKWEHLYSSTMVASSFQKTSIKDDQSADDVINSLQLASFPSDVVVKFDLQHTKEFVKHMSAKKESITKAQKRYISWTDRKDKDAIKGRLLAISAENVDESIEHSKIRWQMFVRVYASSLSLLEQRREHMRTKFKSSKIQLSIEVGRQILLADNLFPYRNNFRKYIQPTDIGYLAQYNFLGGIYIGEDEEGIIETYTMPGELPVFYNTSKILEGKTKTGAPTTLYCGETGGGKTQLADHRNFVDMIFKGRRILTVDPKGDREKKIVLLGDRASHLKIGAKDNPDGMFDCFLMHKEDEKEALAEAKEMISSLSRALNKTQEIAFYHINDAYEDMKKDVDQRRLKQMTFTALLEKLIVYDDNLAKQVLSLKNDPIARLFFASQDTEIDLAFNLNKSYNLITFAEVPIYSKDKKEVVTFDPYQIKHAIFAICISKVTGIVNGFMKRFGVEENNLTFDEYRVWKAIPGGEDVVVNCVVTSRSWRTYPSVITQQLSDINAEILNNTGQIYVGSLKSSKEIEFVLQEMKLDDHDVVRGALIDRTQDEGVKDSKKYVFLLQDYNNRKSLTKLNIPKTFKEAFTTLKDSSTEQLKTPHAETKVSLKTSHSGIVEEVCAWDE
ncbi:hypothetical protein M2475_001614 [Breznakia sp. PF5-3]|uniref:ATP-binding protein n=1 Tax=unclassified Breznakia TaxID=2623764 RepID=UPI0024070DC7|nr:MULTISPECIES: ATP-binding protein [unclassified Breznakia]MDF9825180.1 hypothetical protein [Breznakia sp. PM6-1]MDF9836038.1 hypothetical protein [Breznakia sp. PF5-3]MDF9838601.1 hypothetical protein [Breznakia sp. PFB2-8]MDF9860630.1 hypothetical protein [Breznakia sp. PH5-24]